MVRRTAPSELPTKSKHICCNLPKSLGVHLCQRKKISKNHIEGCSMLQHCSLGWVVAISLSLSNRSFLALGPQAPTKEATRWSSTLAPSFFRTPEGMKGQNHEQLRLICSASRTTHNSQTPDTDTPKRSKNILDRCPEQSRHTTVKVDHHSESRQCL